MSDTRKIAWLVPAALLALSILPMTAQAQLPYPHPKNKRERLADQRARIHAAVVDKKITHAEARNLRVHDEKIHAQIMRDRLHHHGHLTPAENHHITAELNHNSHDIHHDKDHH